MKHLKFFEEITQNMIGSWTLTPEVGDYVICDSTNFDSLKDLVKNNIGKLIQIEKVTHDDDNYYIKYTENENDIVFWRSEILYWSKNKEELEDILKAQKYNL